MSRKPCIDCSVTQIIHRLAERVVIIDEKLDDNLALMERLVRSLRDGSRLIAGDRLTSFRPSKLAMYFATF